MKNLKIFFTAFFLLASSFHSYAQDKQIWSLGNQPKFFYEEADYLLSENCRQQNCQAKVALQKISPEQAKKIKNGKNRWGHLLCQSLVNGRVVVLQDPKKNHNAFCLFSDESLISLGSLEIKALK